MQTKTVALDKQVARATVVVITAEKTAMNEKSKSYHLDI